MGEQTPLELAGCYLGVVPVAVLLAAGVSRRMSERSPRMFASFLSLVAMALYALPDTVSVIAPSSASSLVALASMAGLAICTGFAELLHRNSSRWGGDRTGSTGSC